MKDVVSGMEYEFRVTAINLSGPGESSNPSDFVCARDPKSKYMNGSVYIIPFIALLLLCGFV